MRIPMVIIKDEINERLSPFYSYFKVHNYLTSCAGGLIDQWEDNDCIFCLKKTF